LEDEIQGAAHLVEQRLVAREIIADERAAPALGLITIAQEIASMLPRAAVRKVEDHGFDWS